MKKMLPSSLPQQKFYKPLKQRGGLQTEMSLGITIIYVAVFSDLYRRCSCISYFYSAFHSIFFISFYFGQLVIPVFLASLSTYSVLCIFEAPMTVACLLAYDHCLRIPANR